MEYDSGPSGSSINPLIVTIAGVVALACISAVIAFIVTSSDDGQSTSTTPMGTLGEANSREDGSGTQAGSTDWRRAFADFQENDPGIVLVDKMTNVDGNDPDLFVRLFSGQINPTPGHTGYTGVASIYSTPIGTKILRLHQDLDLTPTPGLTITLSSVPLPLTMSDLSFEYVVKMDVAQLTAFKGEAVFVLPSDLPKDALQSVAFWSEPYQILVAAASMSYN